MTFEPSPYSYGSWIPWDSIEGLRKDVTTGVGVVAVVGVLGILTALLLKGRKK